MIVKHLLIEGGGVMAITHDAAAKTIQVRIDRAKIRSHGLPALNSLLLRLHVWYCTADVEPLRELVERLGTVDGDMSSTGSTVRPTQASSDPSSSAGSDGLCSPLPLAGAIPKHDRFGIVRTRSREDQMKNCTFRCLCIRHHNASRPVCSSIR